MSKAIKPNNWENFLKEFSARNHNRRARFELFNIGERSEETQESHLENISLKKTGNQAQLIVTRIDKSGKENQTMTDTFDNVHGLAVQLESDGSENVLEVSDNKGNLAMLRFESKIDGAS